MEEIKFNEEKVLTNMTEITNAIKTIKIVIIHHIIFIRKCNQMVQQKDSWIFKRKK